MDSALVSKSLSMQIKVNIQTNIIKKCTAIFKYTAI